MKDYFLMKRTRLKNFNLTEAKPTNAPMKSKYLKTEGEEKLLSNNTELFMAVGTLLYLVTITRSYISAALNILS